MPFNLTPNVDVIRDDAQVVRILRHPTEPYHAPPADKEPRAVAAAYLLDVAPIFGIDDSALKDVKNEKWKPDPKEGMRLRRAASKSVLETTTVTFAQTYFGLRVWQAAVFVAVHEPLRVTSSRSTIHAKIDIGYAPDGIEKAPKIEKATLRKWLGGVTGPLEIHSVSRLIYLYDPEARYPKDHEILTSPMQLHDPNGDDGKPPGDGKPGVAGPGVSMPGVSKPGVVQPGVLKPPVGKNLPGVVIEVKGEGPAIVLPKPEGVVGGKHYVVLEVLFRFMVPGRGPLNWRAFIEPKTGTVLYLRAFVSQVNGSGKAFLKDPTTKSGDAPLTSTPDVAALNGRRGTVTLPLAAKSSLSGDYVRIASLWAPASLPSNATGNYTASATTDTFAAVSAYYHCHALFKRIEDLGFEVGSVLFDGTDFPVQVDHWVSIGANAEVWGASSGDGAESIRFGTSLAGSSVGVAADPRVAAHEICHALLWDSIGDGQFGFAHSAGDSLAAILYDPGTSAPDRFATFPWSDAAGRRHDRAAPEWGWDGDNDDLGYGSEQILSSTLFRFYQSAGGGTTKGRPSVSLKTQASDRVFYFIVRAIGSLGMNHPVQWPEDLETALVDADVGTSLFRGIPGGTLHKVIRWSFERQGLGRRPGSSPVVDIYIDDGRNGEYTYTTTYGSTAHVWNRRADDGVEEHESPRAGTNYLYVRVKNKATSTASATNVAVRAYRSSVSSGQIWPTDWTSLGAPKTIASIAPGGSAVAAPFAWTYTSGPWRMLASASVDGDRSNIDPATELPCVTTGLETSLLVPFDNNIVQVP